jgi:hypothetical protein
MVITEGYDGDKAKRWDLTLLEFASKETALPGVYTAMATRGEANSTDHQFQKQIVLSPFGGRGLNR